MEGKLAEQILKELRILRRGQEAIRLAQRSLAADVAAMKITAPECAMTPGLSLDLTGSLQVQIASQTRRIDRFEAGLHRIERFIDPVQA